MNAPHDQPLHERAPSIWQGETLAEVPFRAYTDAELYARELERIFYGPHWCYVGLAAEVPKPGDFKRTFVGERQVVMVRDSDGTSINVVENRCAHRGMQFCQSNFGNVPNFQCPYHQWNYDLKGNLTAVPYRRGIRKQGGMPADFQMQGHGLTQLRVAVHNGVVFASFDPATPPLAEYLSPAVLKYFERVFPDPSSGREPVLLGYSRQRIPGNWKLMQENIKDPYHPGLLHVFFVTFGLWRPDQQSRMITDPLHRHALRRFAGAGRVDVPRKPEAAGRPDPRRRHRAVVERPDRLHDDDLPVADRPAAGQFAVDAAHRPARSRDVRFRLDAFRLHRRHARNDPAQAAPGEPVRTGRVRVGRRWRGDRMRAARRDRA